MIGVHGDHIVRIHVSLVAIDHQIRILPEIPGAIAFARRTGGGIFVGGNHRARLQAVTIFVFDGVLLIVEHGAQPLVQVGDMVSAIKIIIDVHLPVALNVVGSAIEIVELADAKRRDAFH